MTPRSRLLAVSALAFGLSLAAGGGASAATFLGDGQLVISATTYVDTGAAAGLVAGVSQLPGPNAGQSVTAVSGGGLATVFNNDTVDPAFGVTSPISLYAVNAGTGAITKTLNLDPSVVATSFSSKSELGLNLVQTANGPVITFMGYNAPGLGQLDVSNSDTTAYKDTTNPVTSFFAPGTGQTYAYNRDVVAVTGSGQVSTTQTLAYGGNNGRAAVYDPGTGLYYTVGNSNNGTGTPTALTHSTGLEVVTPGSTPNSTMVDPTYYSFSPKDKAGKDANFRGLTLFGGSLYFSKGSGSNGVDTVYSVTPGEPTVGGAAAATISILPGFPTNSAKATGGNFTPFGLFFANSTTLYVADEGTGNSLDATTNAGLEKWSFSGGSWHLDYTLQKGLLGLAAYSVSGTNSGQAGTVSGIQTIGLRNLTGRVLSNGDVTLWATTATDGGYSDTGADPNEVVEISDVLGDTSLPASESFKVFEGPQYGLRYGGVAFNTAVPEPSAWLLMIGGLFGVGGAMRRRSLRAA